MFDNSYVFEPTVTLNGIPILPYGCQVSGGKPPNAVEDRNTGCGRPPGRKC